MKKLLLSCAMACFAFAAGAQGIYQFAYPGFEGELRGARISEKRVVTDRRRITAAGMGVAVDFGLAIVAALRGSETADKLRRGIIAD